MARSRSGFTIIELLVVIAIISVLAAFLLPVLVSAKERGRMTTCQSNLRQISLAFESYIQDHDSLYPCTNNLLLWQGRYWRWSIDSYLSLGASPLDGNPLIADRKSRNVLVCPSDIAAPTKYDNTSYAYSMCFYLSPQQINAMTTFGDTVTPPGPMCIPQKTSMVSFPSQKAIVTEWTSNHESPHVGWHDPATAWEGARNYLFVDGHVKYLKSRKIHPANDGLPDINLTRDGIHGKDID